MARPRRAARRPRAPLPTTPSARRDSVAPAALPRGAWAVAALVGVAVGVAYVRTAARDIVFGDTPELVGAAASLGIAHPPGYPIWTMAGFLFSLLPVGTLPFRLSLFSVAAGVACAVLVYVTAYRLTRNAIASFTGALLLALVPAVWTWSVVPEVFALADALAAALVLLLLMWHLDERPRYFIAAAFVGGLGMAHHQTISLLGPAILFLMWHHRRRFRGGGLIVRATIASLAGLLPYAYLFIGAARHTPWNFGELASTGDVIGHVLRSGYGTGSLISVAQFQGGSALERLLALARSFTVPEAVAIAVGAVALFRQDRAWFGFTAIAALVTGPLFTLYSNVNLSFGVLIAVLERFFLLPHVVLAPLAALGVLTVARAARAPRVRTFAEVASAGAALAVAAVVAGSQLPAIDQSENHNARMFGKDILSSTRQGAILLAAGDPVVASVGYLRTIEGARPDLVMIDMPLLYGDWYIRQLHRKYSALKVPFDRLDGARGTLRSLVEANGVERFDIMGVLIDQSLSGSYSLLRRGLVEELRPSQTTVDIDALASQNETALRGYHIPSPASVATRPWDRLVLSDYGFVAYDIGNLYERAKVNAKARQWYERAVAIAPDLVEARNALAALPP